MDRYEISNEISKLAFSESNGHAVADLLYITKNIAEVFPIILERTDVDFGNMLGDINMKKNMFWKRVDAEAERMGLIISRVEVKP